MKHCLRISTAVLLLSAATNAFSLECFIDTKNLVAEADIIVFGTITTNAQWEVDGHRVFAFPIRVLKVDQVLYGDTDLRAVPFQVEICIDGAEVKEGQSGLWFLSTYDDYAVPQAREWGVQEFPSPRVIDHTAHPYWIDSTQAFLKRSQLQGERSLSKILTAIKDRVVSDRAKLKAAIRKNEGNLNGVNVAIKNEAKKKDKPNK